jgi:hypothetical protein
MTKLLPLVLALAALSKPCPLPPAPQARPATSFDENAPLVLVTQHDSSSEAPPPKDYKRRDILTLMDAARQRFEKGEISVGSRLRFELFDGVWLTAVVRYVEPMKNGVSLIAEGLDQPAHVSLTYDAVGLTAYIDLPSDGDVLISRFADKKSHLISNQYQEQEPLICPARSRRVLRAPDAVALDDDPLERTRASQIDVGVMYTRKALCNLPSGNGCDDEEYLRELLTQWAFKASSQLTCSGINARINLVNVGEINHTETGTLLGDLTAFEATATGSGAALKKFRIDNKADVVLVLVSAATDGSGIAEVFDTATGPEFVDLATGVLVGAQAFGGYLLLHELGHTMGGGHQHADVGRYEYSRANEIRTDQGTRYTLMAESPPAHRLKLFAGPKVQISGGHTGSSSRDNVRTLNETRGMVEAFQAGALLNLSAVPCGAAYYSGVTSETNP